MRKRFFGSLANICLILFSMGVGATFLFLMLHYFIPNGWIFNFGTEDLSKLTKTQKSLLFDAVIQGNVLKTSDILENFTTYYHSLISLLITLLVLMAGFITFHFYRAKEEHDELLKLRIHNLFLSLVEKINENGFKDSLNDYESLQSYLRQRVTQIVETSEDLALYRGDVEAAVMQISNDVIANLLDATARDYIYEDIRNRLIRDGFINAR